jgi:peptidoglycan hydrolase-like protein with peptidoglycan-binding domain
MTVESYASLPFSAGSALAGAAYRSALSATSVFMRQPLRNSALVGLIGLCVLAGGNALYRQHHHPAPLFGSFVSDSDATSAAHPNRDPKTVVPMARPIKLSVDTTETTGNIGPQPAATPSGAPTVIGHDDVVALQKKLAALNLFSGNTDGLFGAKTSAAIRAFEQSVGRPAKGLLTPQVIALIAATPLPQPVAPVAPAKPAVAPLVPPAPIKSVAPSSALPAPSPLAPTDKPAASIAPLAPTASLEPAASQAASDPSSAPADANATPMQTGSLSPVTKRSVQTITVRAEPAQPLPSQLAPPEDSNQATNDPDVVASVQRGLNSLGFLRGNISGIADEATAKAVRNFEVFYNYDVTGRVTKELVDLLKLNGAAV